MNNQNRRENFRIEESLSLAICRLQSPADLPAQMLSADSGLGWVVNPAQPIFPQPAQGQTVADLLIEANTKISLLAEVVCPEAKLPADTGLELSLTGLLAQINRNLDNILRKHAISVGEGSLGHYRASLSAGGIRVRTGGAFSLDDRVQVRFLLDGESPAWIVSCGKVVRVEANAAGGHDVSIAFTNMDEFIQHEIVRHSIRKQREQLMIKRLQEM